MSSGFSYPQPTFQSSIYNPSFYLSLDTSGYLTFDYAKSLYLSKNDYRLTYLSFSPGTATAGSAIILDTSKGITGLGAVACSTLTMGGVAITGTPTLPSYIIGITAGSAAPSSAFVLAASSNISSLCSTYLSGTLQTGSQPNITSLGSLSDLTVSGAVNAGSCQLSGSTLSFNSLSSALGDATANKCISLSSVGVCTFPIGTATTYALSYDTTTGYEARWRVFRAGDDQGLTIGSRSRSIQKHIWGLIIYDAHDVSGVSGSSNAGTWIP